MSGVSHLWLAHLGEPYIAVVSLGMPWRAVGPRGTYIGIHTHESVVADQRHIHLLYAGRNYDHITRLKRDQLPTCRHVELCSAEEHGCGASVNA